MKRGDLTRARHALDAARKALALVRGRSRADLDTDETLFLAVTRVLEIMGEAAASVSTEFRQEHPEVPWRKMVALRNRLIHGYFEIDPDIIWETLTESVPPVVEPLERIVQTVED
jgi:uncharacterized protein with HEPN domain